MARSEQEYITLCKSRIEEKFSFGNGLGYTQRNLETLSQHIEEKTGVYISLSTLKRLWKNNFKQSPQLATLNALAAILDYKDWQDFKLANRKSKAKGSSKALPAGMVIVLLLIAITSFILSGIRDEKVKPRSPVISGPVHFSTTQTVTSGIPNTVIFNYDVSNVDADSFFIQQSWNDNHRVRINPGGNAVSDIYYEAGFHRARLIANDSVIAKQPIHILSNGWEPNVYNDDHSLEPISFKKEKHIVNGQLHLSKELLEKKGLDLSRSFYSRVSNSQIFDVPSDNFSFTTRVKSDTLLNTLCPWITVIIVTEVHIFRVGLQNKGCEKYGGYKIGEIVRNAAENDLSALGCEIYSWQEIGIKVKDKHADIYVNGKKEFTEVFKKDFGKIVGLIYVFEGMGSIDYVKLAKVDGEVVFEDDFEDQSEIVQLMDSDGSEH